MQPNGVSSGDVVPTPFGKKSIFNAAFYDAAKHDATFLQARNEFYHEPPPQSSFVRMASGLGGLSDIAHTYISRHTCLLEHANYDVDHNY